MLELLILLLVAHEADIAWQKHLATEKASAPQSIEATKVTVEKMETK